jgi:hypothetical protein
MFLNASRKAELTGDNCPDVVVGGAGAPVAAATGRPS